MLTWSTSDLARELHTDRNKIDNLRNAGLLHGIKIGKGFVFPEEEVKRFLRDRDSTYKQHKYANICTSNLYFCLYLQTLADTFW